MFQSARGARHDVEISTRSRPTRRGVHEQDRLLERHEELALGAHLVTPRLGFAHHGIYVGEGRVVHYGSFGSDWHRRPVEEVSLAHFTRGRNLWVRPHAASRFGGAEVIRRARSRLGEDSYRLLTNNCEHFCHWCLQGEQHSAQVERLLVLPRELARVLGTAAAGVLAVPSLFAFWR